MKLTNRQIVTLQAALLDLDGTTKADGTEVRFEFTGKVRYAISRCISHLKPQLETIERAKLGLIRQFSEGRAGVAPNSPKFMDCQSAVDELLDQVVEVEVHRLKLADLNLDKNPIVGSTLSDLDPVIDAE